MAKLLFRSDPGTECMERSHKHELLLAISALSALTCSRPAEPANERETLPSRDLAAPIQTDTTSYVLVRKDRGWQTEIPFRFKNVAEDTLYIINCNGAFTVALERKVREEWRLFWSAIINGCFSPPITIAPGDTLFTPWIVWGAAPAGNAGPAFADTTFDGVYRLVWQNILFHYDPQRSALGDSVPVRYRVSNDFVLRVTR